MKLFSDEIDWIGTKLDSYDIEYQETYVELKSEIVKFADDFRYRGDTRPIELMFYDIIKQKFPGLWPFDDFVKQYQLAYRTRLKRIVWSKFTDHNNPMTIPVFALLVLIGFFIPQNKITSLIMLAVLLSFSLMLWVYGDVCSRKIKQDKGRKSLLKGQIRTFTDMLLNICLMLNLLGTIGTRWENASFLNPIQYHPVVFALLISFFINYSLGCLHLIRLEI